MRELKRMIKIQVRKKALLEKSVNKKENKSNKTSNSLFSEQMLKVEIGKKIIKSQLNQISKKGNLKNSSGKIA